MRVPSARTVFTLGLGFVGLAFSIWLAAFFSDTKRPITSQERADLLAAENYRDFDWSASTPFSPSHWEQSFVLLTDATRIPLAREETALLLAIVQGNREVAGVIAFGFMCLALAWLASRGDQLPRGGFFALALTALGIAHAWAWQVTDPSPFLVAGFSALLFATWIEGRAGTVRPWHLGVAAGGLLLCSPVLLVAFAAAVGIDVILERCAVSSGLGFFPTASRNWIAALVLPVLVLFALGLRNWHASGSPWVSPAAAYLAKNSVAPTWLWQEVGIPHENVDPVLERYDHFVSVPAARWAIPVYQAWTARLVDGVRHAGGGVLALSTLAAGLFLCPGRSFRPVLLLGGVIAVLSLVRYSFPAEWWCMLTPALLWGLLEGAKRWPTSDGLPRRGAIAALVIATGQIVALAWEPQIKPPKIEYDLDSQLKEISGHLAKKPGKHLVFVSCDESTDARLDVARLPRHWTNTPILFARELAPEKNTALVKAMPDRKPWRILIYPGRIGLLEWKPTPSGTPEVPASAQNASAEAKPNP